jgi:predicted permease
MQDILTRAGSFVAIIFLGYFLKRIGFFKQEDFTILSRITIRITLPAAIVMNFAGKEIDPAMLGLGLLGLGGGAVYVLLGYLMNRRNSKEQQSFEMLNLAGYNIGTFVLPFAQNFLGPVGVISTSLFDTGNSFICLGGAYSIAAMVKDGKGFSFKRIFRAMATSVPFVTYVIMVTVTLANIPVPGFVVSFAGIIASANTFMAMLMIGVGFKLESNRAQLGRIAKILSVRYGVATILALIYYFVLPLDIQIRQALVILAFSPIGSAVPGFTGELKGDVGLSSALNSITIVISIVIIVTLLSIML